MDTKGENWKIFMITAKEIFFENVTTATELLYERGTPLRMLICSNSDLFFGVILDNFGEWWNKLFEETLLRASASAAIENPRTSLPNSMSDDDEPAKIEPNTGSSSNKSEFEQFIQYLEDQWEKREDEDFDKYEEDLWADVIVWVRKKYKDQSDDRQKEFLNDCFKHVTGPRAKNSEFYQQCEGSEKMKNLKPTKWLSKIVFGFEKTRGVDPFIFTLLLLCIVSGCIGQGRLRIKYGWEHSICLWIMIIGV